MHVFVSQIGSDPLLLGLVLGTAFIAFVLTSTFGIGGPIILIPVLMLRLPAAQAIAVVVPVQLCNNLLMLVVQRRHVQVRAALVTGLSALPAALIAALLTRYVDARWLKLGVGAIILALLLHRYGLKLQFAISERGLLGWGALIGTISGFTGNAGPTTALAMKGYGLQGSQLVGTIALLQMALQLVRLPAYIATGLFPATLWSLAALLSVIAMVAVFVGQHLLYRLKGNSFQSLFDILLLLIALWLFFTAFRA
ncbi:MAG: hypothetical protein NVSMB49_24640 [Ktedonobacteraceae bacterium]